MLREHAFQPDVNALHTLLNRTCEEIDAAENHTQLMLVEAKLTKALYKMVSQTVGYGDFTRAKRGGGIDMANRFLDQGNYLGLWTGSSGGVGNRYPARFSCNAW